MAMAASPSSPPVPLGLDGLLSATEILAGELLPLKLRIRGMVVVAQHKKKAQKINVGWHSQAARDTEPAQIVLPAHERDCNSPLPIRDTI